MAGEAFELERFEWTDDKRIEVAGRWVGVRGRRFVRPTLTLRGAGAERRILALLDHKPWDPGQAEWQAAFAYDEEPAGFDEAELAVAPGLEVTLPVPRQPSAKSRRRKAKRYEARMATVAIDAPVEVTTTPAAPAPPPPTPPRREYSVQLLDELATLRAHAERIEAELGDTRAERDELSAERDRLETERDSATAELDRATAAVEASEDELGRAIRELEATKAERDALLPGHATAERERSALQLKLDAALRSRDALREERDTALAEREASIALRDAALAEREQVKRSASLASLPRSSIYTSTRQKSLLALWTPRLIALAIVIAFVVIALLLFHG